MPEIERKPHLLHVSIDWYGNEGISYEIECPYDDLGDQRPCVTWEECSHSGPQEPESDEPAYTDWRDPTTPKYDPASDPKIVAEWEAYWEAHAEWEKTHPNGPWERTDECWARQYVQEGSYEDGWQFGKGFKQEVMGPVPVECRNGGGGLDDTSLLLFPWKESDGE